MLKELIIQNFQAHKKTELILSPRVNTIVGETDAGKSALFRCIKWVAMNTPSGDAFIRHGTKEARVEIKVDDVSIIRTKSASKNTYHLDDEEFNSFRNDPPEEIQRAINLGEINFQGQFDSPFWFSETAGEVSRQLNDIVDLAIIDQTLSNIVKRVNKSRQESESLDKLYEDARESRASMDFVPEMERDFAEVEGLGKESNELAESRRLLHSVLSSIQTHQREEEKLRDAVYHSQEFLDSWKECNRVAKEIITVRSLCTSVKELSEKSSVPDMPLDELRSVAAIVKAVTMRKNDLKKLLDVMKVSDKDMVNQINQAKRFEKELHEAIGETCPLCHQAIQR